MNLGVQLCIYIITWNVNSRNSNSKVYIDNLIKNQIHSEDYNQICETPDIYVIGLQEVNSSPQNLVNRIFVKEDAWVTKFRNAFSHNNYVLLNSKQMQGILLIVFVQRKHLLYLRNIEAQNTRKGFGGFWGNKGAVSTRMDLYGSSITFINSHLPAHENKLDDRIQDYNNIVSEHYYHVDYHHSIFDHDYVFWFGDLNFRLFGKDLSATDIKNLINDNQFDVLLEKDELNLVRQQNKAFNFFREEKINFPPTFKFFPGTLEYNLKRKPAWTDRILHLVKDESSNLNFTCNIKQISYKSHPEYLISDHKPVSGQFLIDVLGSFNHDVIEFSHIYSWKMGAENIIEYTIPENFVEQEGDWIGIYLNDFGSINDYLAYEYAKHSEKVNNKRYMRSEFSENVNLIQGQVYTLLYIQNSNLGDVYSVIGISNIFHLE